MNGKIKNLSDKEFQEYYGNIQEIMGEVLERLNNIGQNNNNIQLQQPTTRIHDNHTNQQPTNSTTNTNTTTNTNDNSTPTSSRILSTPQSIEKKSNKQVQLKFSTNGEIIKTQRNQHYFYLEPKQCEPLKESMILNEYTCLFGPRSAGKSTTALRTTELVNQVHGHLSLRISFEGRIIVNESIDFWRILVSKIYECLKPNDPIYKEIDKMGWKELKFLLMVDSTLFGKYIVHLVIDEFDAIFNFKQEIITEILSEFRLWKSQSIVAIRSIMIVGTFAILELKASSTVSPFNIKNHMVVENFSEQEVTTLMNMYANQKAVNIKKSIIQDIYSLTNGHKGLVNVIGDLLNETFKEHATIEPNVWNDLINRRLFKRLSRYSTVERMIDWVVCGENKEVKKNLWFAIYSGLDGNSPSNIPESKEALYLSREGIYTPNNKEFSSNIVKQICLYQMETITPSEEIPFFKNKHLDMENILKIAVRYISPLVIKHAISNSNKVFIQNLSQLKKGDFCPCEFVYTNQISLILTNWFKSRFNHNVIVSPNNNIISTNERPDLVVTTSPLKEGQKSIIIELVATTKIKDIEDHIIKTNGYIQNNDFYADEGWVLHFTMAKNSFFYNYPSVPRIYPKVGIIHIYHDENYNNLSITCYPPKLYKKR
ncbi:hypothetical protein ACTFIZ_011821 [Dictyostelium cf. discoideum]